MTQYAQPFEQELQPIHGWFEEAPLEKVRPLKSALLTGTTAVPAGRCVSLDSNGDIVLGLSSNHAMPMWLKQGKDSLDVQNDGTSPVTSTVHWHAVVPRGWVSALVATGGYELQTPEFDTTKTYAANDPLTADTAGKLTNASVTLYTTPVVGVCSWHETQKATGSATGPVGTNAHGVKVITFWPVYLPV